MSAVGFGSLTKVGVTISVVSLVPLGTTIERGREKFSANCAVPTTTESLGVEAVENSKPPLLIPRDLILCGRSTYSKSVGTSVSPVKAQHGKAALFR